MFHNFDYTVKQSLSHSAKNRLNHLFSAAPVQHAPALEYAYFLFAPE
jgi:hypothetical protein